jgi:hypothetical protein
VAWPDTPPAAGRAWVPCCRARTFYESVTPLYDESTLRPSPIRDQFVILIDVHVPMPLTAACALALAPRQRASLRRPRAAAEAADSPLTSGHSQLSPIRDVRSLASRPPLPLSLHARCAFSSELPAFRGAHVSLDENDRALGLAARRDRAGRRRSDPARKYSLCANSRRERLFATEHICCNSLAQVLGGPRTAIHSRDCG